MLLFSTITSRAGEFVDLTSDEMKIDSVLPEQSCVFPLPRNYADSVYTVSLLYPEYVPLTRKEIRRYKKLVGDKTAAATPVMEYVYTRERTDNQLCVYFTPIVKQGGHYYYISSYKPSLRAVAKKSLNFSNALALEIENQATVSANPADNYKKVSQLSTGKWAKISVPSTGIFRLTDAVIRKAGFSDMSKVHIYGYGGNIVPEKLSQEWIVSHDDLPEVATVTINGEKYFYALGPVSWESATTVTRTRNPYSDVGCYFITEDDTAPLTTTEEALLQQVRYSNDVHHYLYEVDDFAWAEIGRNLYDKTPINSGSSKIYNIPIPQGNTSADVSFNITAGSASTVNVTTVEGGEEYNYTFGQMSSSYEKVRKFGTTFSFNEELLAKCGKDDRGNIIIPIKIECASGGPVRLDYISAAFSKAHDVPALSSSAYPAADYVYNITNQNHHADKSADLIIIIPTSQKWYSQAKRLGDLHVEEEKTFGKTFTYNIVPADELYNEFSSGTPDVSAYRRYLKMFYDRANSSGATSEDKIPQSVLLFGDCKWDNRLKTLSSYSADDMLLIYETENSEFTTASTGIDDFITILGDNQTVHQSGSSSSNLRFDLGVGRLCVSSLSQATEMVNKVETYMNRRASGSWVNTLIYMADDDANAGNSHMKAIDTNADNIISKRLGFDVHKVLLDAYERTSTSTGYRYYGAHDEVVNTLNSGALILNYGGHASPVQFADENVLTLSDMKNLTGNNYSFIFTAACETMPFDQTIENMGCAAVLNTNGGAIAFLGTLRTVYANYNESLDYAFMDYLLSSDYDGLPMTISEALRITKNYMVSSGRDRTVNKHQYHIFGDPALRLAIPGYKTVVDEINHISVQASDDELNDEEEVVEIPANAVVKVKGHVETFDGKRLTDYKGTAFVYVKDALESITTRNNDGVSQITYLDRLSNIYKGSAGVANGEFTVNFRVGSDIVDNGDTGLINVFAVNATGATTAFGECNGILFTGSEEAEDDKEGPDIDAYLNTPSFVNGGTVGSTPYFYVTLEDKDGLDVMGNTTGHNIELVIDDEASKTYNLNNSFTFDEGSYTRGTANYVIPALSAGNHTLRIRAWDILGNMSSKTVSFSVDSNLQPTIKDIFVAPNPVHGSATFYLYHDFQGSNAEIRIEIIDMSGRIMQSNTWYQPLGVADGRTPLKWDSVSVPNGLYLYRVRLSCNGVNYSSKTKKLIVAQ